MNLAHITGHTRPRHHRRLAAVLTASALVASALAAAPSGAAAEPLAPAPESLGSPAAEGDTAAVQPGGLPMDNVDPEPEVDLQPAPAPETAPDSEPDPEPSPDPSQGPDPARALMELPPEPPKPALENLANNPHCRPAPEHPNPVLFIHGTMASSKDFEKLAAKLTLEGFCTWAFDYGQRDNSFYGALPGVYGVADLASSARELAQNIATVQHQTGAGKVDIVAFSQGATLTKIYTQSMGGAENIGRVVAMGGNFHGTTLNGAGNFAGLFITAMPGLARFFASTAAIQQVVSSPQMVALNALPDTTPGVTYTSITSPADTTVTPNSTSHLTAVGGADVANVDLDSTCHPERPVRHQKLPMNPGVHALVHWGLTRAAGDTQPSCEWDLPVDFDS
ncbi:esterase/lipase family protein [Corynebacterium atypicum]|uniref:esterase/lipase family protein n=1 Tax=Corynebacterium atypicum TaxID=191610 RepID=UPI000690EC0C|nr:alpha/beta fold hydrolase [Corynebacterium atypicum]